MYITHIHMYANKGPSGGVETCAIATDARSPTMAPLQHYRSGPTMDTPITTANSNNGSDAASTSTTIWHYHFETPSNLMPS
jgi:hypothetical protein